MFNVVKRLLQHWCTFSLFAVLLVIILATISNNFLFFHILTASADTRVTVPSGFVHSDFVTDLEAPTVMEFAPDGRLFVAEKGGTLRIVEDEVLFPTPFISLSVDSSMERGLLGLAFDPDFESNGYIYLHYTTSTGPIHNRISRFTANETQPNLVVPGSEQVLLDIPGDIGVVHHGGAIHFGNDGKLYIAVGDNTNPPNAQSLDNLFGKILRINADGSVPEDNPFYNVDGAMKKIWALGLRNPYTFAFKPGTDIMYINDVGFHSWEEINQGLGGANYGWPICEGVCSDPNVVNPVYSYQQPPDDEGAAVIGGAFYVDNQFPSEYYDNYFFGDYVRGFIKTWNQQTVEVVDFAQGVDGLVDIKIGPDGSLYYLSITEGNIGKIQYISGDNNFPFAIAVSNITLGLAPLAVHFDASESGDPDAGDILSYIWDFGDGSPISTDPSAVHTFDTDGPYTAELSVSDGNGGTDQTTIEIRVGVPPVANIVLPSPGTFYSAGDTIMFSGSATDGNGNALPASAFSWKIRFQHNIHYHPFDQFSDATEGSFEIPRNGETSADVWYRIYLTVTDSSGLTHVSFRDILPNKVTFIVDTEPPGLTINLDGQPQRAPKLVTGVVGMNRILEAPLENDFCSQSFEFSSWKDGESEPSRTIVTPSGFTIITAEYNIASANSSDAHKRATSDFNGDGYSDLSIGVPGENIGSKSDAGVVSVLYGASSEGLSATTSRADQIFSQDSSNIEGSNESGDRLGSSVAPGDFNNDGYDDLAIGVPFEDIGSSTSKVDAGSLNVIYGSLGGLSATSRLADQTWSQDRTNIEDTSEKEDNFARSLAAGDFNTDGYDDLAIGIPNEDINGIVDAGAVSVLYGSSAGLSATPLLDQFWSQNSVELEGTAEKSDQFGWSLGVDDFNADGYDDLAIGVLGEDNLVGSVNVIYGSLNGLSTATSILDQIWSQDSPEIEGSLEGKDGFGYSLAGGDFDCDGFGDLAIGSLEEGSTPALGAGAVNVIYGSTAGLSPTTIESDGTGQDDQEWTQDSSFVEQFVEADDRFGYSLTIGDFNKDGFDDLAIGVPGQNNIFLGFENTGAVNVIYGSFLYGLSASDALVPDQLWFQDSAHVYEGDEINDLFGSSLSAGDFNADGYDDLVIGVPYENINGVDAGVVHVIHGSPHGLAASTMTFPPISRNDQLWHQNIPSIDDSNESGDIFGSSLASG